MSRKRDIAKKLFLGAIFPKWRRERQRYEVVKMKFEIYKITHFQNSRKTFQIISFFLEPNDWTNNRNNRNKTKTTIYFLLFIFLLSSGYKCLTDINIFVKFN